MNGDQESLSVVTGAAGFVGRAIVRRLLTSHGKVRALVLPGDPLAGSLRSEQQEGRLDIIEGDVTRPQSLARLCEGAKCVFHTAALVHGAVPWAAYRRVNVDGTRNVATAACDAGVKRFLAVSTSDVFGIPRRGERIDESTAYRYWRERYPDTKIEAERWLWSFCRDKRLPLTVIYPGWVYGPGDRAFFPSLARAVEDRFMLFWLRDVLLPWAYIDNLAEACVLAAEHPSAAGEGFLIHDGMDGPTLQDVCARIAKAIGAPGPWLHLPYGVVLPAAWLIDRAWRLLHLKGEPPLLTNDVKSFGHRWDISNEKARQVLGWRPAVDFERGMQAAIEFLVASRRGATSARQGE